MKTIKLTGGGETVVSDEDFHALSAYAWRAWEPKAGYIYACRCERGKRVLMHRAICGVAGLVVDHINGQTLDNRRENLRAVTATQNKQNITKPTRAASGHANVFRQGGGFIVRFVRNGIRHYGGWHPTIGAALAARDAMRLAA